MANAIIAAANTEARELAADILAGDDRPYGDGVYSASDWRKAAQYLVDTDDCDEVLFMMAQEIAAERTTSEDLWADEADYRYDLMREEQMLAAWERAA
jgi:hypothetical protein